MKYFTKLLNSQWKKVYKLAGLILVIGLLLLRFIAKFIVMPDSGQYMMAAYNFAKHGTFFIYMNWPERTLLPNPQIYADYPPGYPSFLTPFYYFIHDPILAVQIAQSIALLMLFSLVYFFLNKLQIPAALKLGTVLFLGMFAPHRVTLQAPLTEPLYISLCIICLWLAVNLLQKSENKITWRFSYLFLFLAASVRWNGFACALFFLYPALMQKKHFFKKVFFVGFFSALPISLWFIRNKFLSGKVSAHYGMPTILWEKAAVPFIASIKWWGFDHTAIALFILFLSLTPILSNKIKAFASMQKYYMIWLACLSQFLVMYILSLIISNITPVNDRYLMPTYFFFTMALVYSLSCAAKALKKEQWLSTLSLICLFVFYPYSVVKSQASPGGLFHRQIPIEEFVWREIKTKSYFQQSEFFYSDENYLHQIFALKPNVVLWPTQPSEDLVKSLWNQDKNHFFILSPQSNIHPAFKALEKNLPDLKKESISNFTIYYHSSS